MLYTQVLVVFFFAFPSECKTASLLYRPRPIRRDLHVYTYARTTAQYLYLYTTRGLITVSRSEVYSSEHIVHMREQGKAIWDLKHMSIDLPPSNMRFQLIFLANIELNILLKNIF